jgi:glyoxylase-like metal-dependent hydrolase (beta-lactamase superfamily II)
MKIHHLNCGTLVAPFVDIKSLVYCLVVETSQGLILIDTGFGTRDYTDPTLKMRFFLSWMGVPRLQEETALSQIKALGYRPEDVKHIIQTHLHIDHAGGLADFPWAEVHVYHKEFQAIQNPRGPLEYAYVQDHWAHGPSWIVHEEAGEHWFGFNAIRVLETQEADFFLIPLPGHTRGHCGVAIGKPGNWLMHCGDAASPYHRGGDLHNRDESVYGLRFFPDKWANQILGGHVPKLRALLQDHGDEIKSISAHDVFSFREYTLNQNTSR